MRRAMWALAFVLAAACSGDPVSIADPVDVDAPRVRLAERERLPRPGAWNP